MYKTHLEKFSVTSPMPYVSVPKDLSRVKNKVLFNLTKRQLIWFGAAILLGLPLFFLLKSKVNPSAATLCMIIVMMPCFLMAMYEKNGQPMEKLLKHFIEAQLIRPKQRPYRTNNFYAVLGRQNKLDREVKSIVIKSFQPPEKITKNWASPAAKSKG